MAYDPNYDTMYHIGEAEHISNTGHFSDGNWYPIIHIFIAILYFFGFSYENATLLLSSLYSIAFLIFAILLSKCIARSYYERVLIICCASPLFFQMYHMVLMPFYCSLWTIPLILYVLHMIRRNTQNNKFTILLMILIVNIVFFHPLTTLIVALIIAMLIISEKINSHISRTTEKANGYFYFLIFISLISIFLVD